MKKFCKNIFGDDKVKHIFASFVIGALCAFIMSFIPLRSSWIAFWVAFGVSFAFGIGKEIYDSRQEGNHFCLWDLVADLIGATAGAFMALGANYFTWN